MFSRHVFSRTWRFETQRLLQAMPVPPDGQRTRHIDDLIRKLIACGAWYKFDGFYMMAAHDATAAAPNWVNPGAGAATTSGGPTFVVDRGYNGDGTAVIQFITIGPTKYVQNDAHAGVYTLTTSADTSVADIGENNVGRMGIRCRTTTNAGFRCNSVTTSSATTGPAAYPAYMLTMRRASTDQLLYVNGALDTTAAVTSTGTITTVTACGCTPLGNSDRQEALIHHGASLTDAEAMSVYQATRDYLQVLGAVV